MTIINAELSDKKTFVHDFFRDCMGYSSSDLVGNLVDVYRLNMSNGTVHSGIAPTLTGAPLLTNIACVVRDFSKEEYEKYAGGRDTDNDITEKIFIIEKQSILKTDAIEFNGDYYKIIKFLFFLNMVNGSDDMRRIVFIGRKLT